ncbi:hypothetical protein [Oceanobacillus sp. CF4.6]|uniref:hypothetical protein n=1 Tax=Oceanobacillus sp. CF4.6 TaxID=3373080 RepID=UPI003EE81A82
MDKKKIYQLAVLILPWLTVPFLRRKSFFRFLPAASFISLFLNLLSVTSNKQRWWKTKNPLFGVPIDYPYILGTYFVGTLWIFKLTYGNFPKYIITNLLVNLLNAYPFMYISEKLGVIKFKKMTKTMWYFITVLMSLWIYGFQFIVEKAMTQRQKAD